MQPEPWNSLEPKCCNLTELNFTGPPAAPDQQHQAHLSTNSGEPGLAVLRPDSFPASWKEHPKLLMLGKPSVVQSITEQARGIGN